MVHTYRAVPANREGREVATLPRRLAATTYHHQKAGHAVALDGPALKAICRGIGRPRAVCEAAFRAEVVRYSPYVGSITSAAAAGARLDEIIDQTGHARVGTETRYVRNARASRASAVAKLVL